MFAAVMASAAHPSPSVTAMPIRATLSIFRSLLPFPIATTLSASSFCTYSSFWTSWLSPVRTLTLQSISRSASRAVPNVSAVRMCTFMIFAILFRRSLTPGRIFPSKERVPEKSETKWPNRTKPKPGIFISSMAPSSKGCSDEYDDKKLCCGIHDYFGQSGRDAKPSEKKGCDQGENKPERHCTPNIMHLCAPFLQAQKTPALVSSESRSHQSVRKAGHFRRTPSPDF